jgi:hypothetical protein
MIPCNVIASHPRTDSAKSNVLCPGYAQVLNNLLWSITPYLDLALIFLLFRLSLRIRFFLHCNNITYLIMKVPKFQTPNNIWGNSSNSLHVFRLQKRAIRIITGSRPRDSCRGMFKNLRIQLVSVYTLSFAIRYEQ